MNEAEIIGTARRLARSISYRVPVWMRPDVEAGALAGVLDLATRLDPSRSDAEQVAYLRFGATRGLRDVLHFHRHQPEPFHGETEGGRRYERAGHNEPAAVEARDFARAVLREALRRLPMNCRKIIADIAEGKERAEIGDERGTTAGAVGLHIQRIRGVLLEVIDELRDGHLEAVRRARAAAAKLEAEGAIDPRPFRRRRSRRLVPAEMVTPGTI